MHLRDRGSFDAPSDRAAVLRAARARGVDRVCVTDHNEIAVALELRERYPDRVIVGEEVKTAEGVDLIGLFLHEPIPKGTPARETCERSRAQGGLVYVPHPFAGGKGGGGRILPEVADLVDVVEAFNARIHFRRLNEAAAAWAAERGLPVGAGSDAHTLREVGRAYVEVPAHPITPAGLLEALRRGRIVGRLSSWGVHLGSTYAKVRKRWGSRSGGEEMMELRQRGGYAR
jgi:predicted metal-dependent phosphoesterase TrpH